MKFNIKFVSFLLGVLLFVLLSQCGRANSISMGSPYNPGFKVTILSAGTHETFFYSGCQIVFESNVHKAFEASCNNRKVAHRPFQAQPKSKDFALLVNDMFFYDCELVGAWTGSDPDSGMYLGNRIWHCGNLIDRYSTKREGEP